MATGFASKAFLTMVSAAAGTVPRINSRILIIHTRNNANVPGVLFLEGSGVD